MNTYYLPVAAILLLFFIMIRKQGNVIKTLVILSLAFIAFLGAFLAENLQSAHVAKAVQSVKHWIEPEQDQGHMPVTAASDYSVDIIPIKDAVLLDAPIIWQMPELPRGCEVTSLAMLLQYQGIQVDKLTLANEVKKNPAEYKLADGKIYFGDPNEGFVGNMYTYTKPGLGVYHKPIAQLAEKYLPGKIRNMTNADFAELKTHLSDGRPIWVIINTQYKKIDESYFQTWYTPNGEVRVTTKEHSVLLTGYDREYVYFNDPLTGEKNKKAPMNDFEESWVQMGRQAITYLPN